MSNAVVLVCDRPESLEALSAAIASHGYRVERAEDGYRAAELASRVTPNLLVARIGVPGPPGPELVRRVRLVAPESQAVMILADEEVETAAELLRAGTDGVLLPDPTPEFLLWTIEQVLAGGSVVSPPLARSLVERFAEAVHREREWARSLADTARQAEQLTRMKAEFLSNVSHELRTPLTIIKGVAQVISKLGNAPPEQAAMLANLDEAATKLTRMVESLLTIAEMERGEFRLNVEDCDVAELVREGAADAASRFPGLNLDLRVPPSISAKADPERIREVVRQIVDNACRYSEQAGTVTVYARRAVEGIVVTVTDQGRGVDRKVVAAAFGEAFSPGEDVLTKQRAGLGLGLNLARSLVTLHGGILSAEPLPGGGSKCSFVIPPEAEAPEPDVASVEVEAESDDPLDKLRALQQRLADAEARADW